MNTSDFYFDLLSNLTPDNKLELISRLSESLKTKKRIKETSLKSLFGAFKSKKTGEQIIDELRADRSFGRKIETL
ncbi:MAG: hypothetical protein JST83_00205 [Bacteroidetes bacterium]|nr:hypothetical protein [Bacteroidota bacterium]